MEWAHLRPNGMREIDLLRFFFAVPGIVLLAVKNFANHHGAALAGLYAALGNLVTI